MKRRLIPFLLALALLTACGGGAETPSAGPSAVAENTPSPSPAPTPEPEDPIRIDASLYTPDGCRFPLLETEDVSLEIVFARPLDNSGTLVLCRAENRADESRTIRLSDVMLNGTIRTDADAYVFTDPGTVGWSVLRSDFPELCARIGYENLTELSAVARIDLPDGTSAPIPCRVEFPGGVHPHFAYEAFRGMRADRQVLRQDENVTIALLGAGQFYSVWKSDSLTVVLWIENNGSEPIPAHVSNVSLSGSVVSHFSPRCELDPGESCILTFSVYAADFDAAGIGSIDSFRLQILTDDESNSGGRYPEGGFWYPVSLSEAGAPSAIEDGTTVYDDGLLRLGLIRTETERVDWMDPPYVNVSYFFSVENRRAEGIRLDVLEPAVDGEPYRSELYGSSFVSILNGKLGPNSRGVAEVRLELAPDDVTDGAAPAFSFILRVLSEGGDTIFTTSAEPIVLAEEPVTEEP